MLEKVKKWIQRISLVSAVLAVLSGLQSNFTVAILDTEVGGVVTWLHWSAEEGSTRRANLKAGSSHYFLQSSVSEGLSQHRPYFASLAGASKLVENCFERNCANNLTTSQAFQSISGEFLWKIMTGGCSCHSAGQRMQTAEITLAICQSSPP